MSDLVKRLENLWDMNMPLETGELGILREAADEIRQLREAARNLIDALDDGRVDDLTHLYEALDAAVATKQCRHGEPDNGKECYACAASDEATAVAQKQND